MALFYFWDGEEVKIPANISYKKLKAVRQAQRLWRSAKGNNVKFSTKLEAHGWVRAGFGSFKQCYSKGSIVVKYSTHNGNNWEVKREWEQWNCAPKGLRKHLPWTYCILDGRVLIQDRVLCKKGSAWQNNLASKFELKDQGHNYGYSKRGVVKFYDWVYRRDNNHVDDHDLPLTKKYR